MFRLLVIAVLAVFQSTVALGGASLGLSAARSGLGVTATRDTRADEFVQGTLAFETLLHFSADYCFYQKPSEHFRPYVGAGLTLYTRDEDALVGLRVPLGFSLKTGSPVIALEMVPTILLGDTTSTYLDLGISLRVPL